MIERLCTLSAIISLAATAGFGQARCRQGFVWREAYPGDYVCVTPEGRDQAARDNATAAGDNAHQTGPGACKPGYVWREALPEDHVCVTPAVRGQVRADNANAPKSVVGCRQGFVWRETSPGDYLCVTPETRSQAAQDNQTLKSVNAHQSAFEVCNPGYVWREASPRDHVCVTPEVRQQTRNDNASTAGNLPDGGGPAPPSGTLGGGAPPPPPARPPAPPPAAPAQRITNVQVIGGPVNVTFAFNTAVATEPWVEVSTRPPGNDLTFNSKVPFSVKGPNQTVHKIQVRGLSVGPAYYYVISAADGAGRVTKYSGKFNTPHRID